MRLLPLVAVAVAVNLGCGSSGVRRQAPPIDAAPGDAGAPVDAGADIGQPDAWAADAALAIPPHGTQLLPSSGNIWLQGVTSDGLAIYADTLTGEVSAVPIAGGTPSLITKVPGQFTPTTKVVGSAVAISAGAAVQNTVALWTVAHGGQLLSTSGSADVAVSSDGEYVLFFDGIGRDDVSLFAARTDGSARARLDYIRFPNPFDPNGCPGFKMGFSGAYAIAAYCQRPASGDLPQKIQVASWQVPTKAATWTRALQVPESMEVWAEYAADRDATQVLVRTMNGLQVYPIAGGVPTTVDARGAFGAFTSDGKNVIYTTEDKQLRRSPVSSPLPFTLLDRGAEILQAVSPDEKAALVSSGSENAATLLLASTTKAGAPLFEASGPAHSSDAFFTADSKYAVYSVSEKNLLGQVVSPHLEAIPATGAGAPMAVTAGIEPQWVRPAGGARLDLEAWRDGSFSVWTADLSKDATAAPLVSDVGEAFPTAANDQIVYRWHLRPGPLAGLWVTPVP
ncbi:MAG TPA: hypothetical protein VFH73_24360 [Polyangia bacterium]|nr:hypothetical protein [Polyangia bacterium]